MSQEVENSQNLTRSNFICDHLLRLMYLFLSQTAEFLESDALG